MRSRASLSARLTSGVPHNSESIVFQVTYEGRRSHATVTLPDYRECQYEHSSQRRNCTPDPLDGARIFHASAESALCAKTRPAWQLALHI
jgi:hypothetical protein